LIDFINNYYNFVKKKEEKKLLGCHMSVKKHYKMGF
jgi:hypothetical protein